MKKKIFLSIMLAFCLLFSGIMLTACNDDDPVVKIEQANGVVTRIAQNAELDTSAISVTVKFKSGKTETVTSADLTFSALDTSTVGNKTLTITYKVGEKEFTFNATIEVYDPNEAPTYVVMEYTDPQFVTQYKTNSQLENAYTETGSTGAKGFTVTGNAYLVGNQNAFVYEPTVGVRYSNNQVGEITDHPAVYKVYLWETDAYRLLTADELATIVTIDENAHTLKFATTANGRYKISVLPKDVSQDELDNIDASEFEFTVVDGYNVYDAKDLSVLDNTNVNGKWNAYKNANNIPMDLTINRIILQRNIDIEANDIPSVHYWKTAEVAGATDEARVVGSLKDTTDADTGYIYRRTLTNGATFRFDGNYFRISAEHLPLIVRERGASTSQEGDAITAHTCLFDFCGPTNGTQQTNVRVENVSFFGNTKKTENYNGSGGVLLMKKDALTLTVYNSLAQGWNINFMSEEGYYDAVNYPNFDPENIALRLVKVNAFDSYSTLIYNWGGVLEVEDCVIIGAGGPVMICDHVDNNKTTGEGGVISTVIVVNSTLESWVAGTEGWFVSYDATELAGMIKALNGIFVSENSAKVTILDNSGTKMNLVAVYKSSAAEGINTSVIRGTFEDYDYQETKVELVEKLETLVNGAAGFRVCINQLVAANQIPSQTIGDQIYNYVTTNGTVTSFTRTQLQTKLNELVTAEYLTQEQADGIYYFATNAADRLVANATDLSLDVVDVTSTGFRICIDNLVTMNQIPNSTVGDQIYNYVTTNGTVIALTQAELQTKLGELVAGSFLTQEQAEGIFAYAQIVAMQYGRTELATVLGNFVTAEFLTEEEVNKILTYCHISYMDASREEIKNYLGLMHDLGQMTDEQYNAALGAIYVQTSNGAFGLTSTDSWAMTPAVSSALTGVTFANAEGYLSIYLPNGMVAVFSMEHVTAA